MVQNEDDGTWELSESCDVLQKYGELTDEPMREVEDILEGRKGGRKERRPGDKIKSEHCFSWVLG